jgi:large subunit ribosomal protein L15
MKLHDLRPRKGSRKGRKRVGRGYSAGQGKTAGRGTKGQRARSGFGGKLYHQGGSLPFFRRLPFKRGFTNINRIEWVEVNLDRLGEFPAEAEVTPEALVEAGILKNLKKPVVLLGSGEVNVPLNIRLHRITRGAQVAVEAAGGTVEVIEV